MKRFFTLIVVALLSGLTAQSGTIYWVGTTGNYSDPANWNTQSNGSGTSGTPTNLDDIVFDRNATVTIDGVYFPSSVWIVNNANVSFTNSAVSRIYTIGGSSTVFPQFKVEAGATLNVTGTASITIEMLAGSTAQIFGTVDITGSSSRMNYISGITFVMNGGKVRYGPGSSNGTGSVAGLSMLGGSTYEVYKNGGSFPTGTYDVGSLLLNTGAVANAALFNMNSSVGSYGQYEFNSPGYTNTTNGINQNVTFSGFKITDDGSGKWILSTSSLTEYTLTVNGDFLMEANTTLDINRASSGSQATTVRVSGNFSSLGSITESGNNTGSVIELSGTLPSNLSITPFTLSGDVSLRINRSATVLSGDLYMPNSPNAKLFLVNGNIDVKTNSEVVVIQSTLPDAIVGGSVSSHIIGRLLRNVNQTAAYVFPVSDNATQLANLTITPSNTNAVLWDVEFLSPNPNANSGLTPGVVDMVTPYYWSIANNGLPTDGASTITARYADLSASTVIIPAQLKMLRWNGTSWLNLGGLESGGNLSNTLGSTGGAAPADPLTGFTPGSFFALGGILGTLPVSIEYFTGVKSGRNHRLDWRISCTNTAGVTITVERSADGRTFKSFRSIEADAVRCLQPFTETDAEPLPGLNYYRLKVADIDGKITYSKIIGLLNRNGGFEIVNIAPNPAPAGQDNLLTISTTKKENLTVLLTDVNGKKISSRVYPVIAGSNQLKLNTQDLPSGQYQVTILSDSGEIISSRFVRL